MLDIENSEAVEAAGGVLVTKITEALVKPLPTFLQTVTQRIVDPVTPPSQLSAAIGSTVDIRSELYQEWSHYLDKVAPFDDQPLTLDALTYALALMRESQIPEKLITEVEAISRLIDTLGLPISLAKSYMYESLSRRKGNATKEVVALAIAAGYTKTQLAELGVATSPSSTSSPYSDLTGAIATTAAVSTFNHRLQQLAGQFGYGKKKWLAVMDERTRESHAKANGQTVPVGENFQVGDYSMEYPGDRTAPPGETANCRCVLYTTRTSRFYKAEDIAIDSAPTYRAYKYQSQLPPVPKLSTDDIVSRQSQELTTFFASDKSDAQANRDLAVYIDQFELAKNVTVFRAIPYLSDLRVGSVLTTPADRFLGVLASRIKAQRLTKFMSSRPQSKIDYVEGEPMVAVIHLRPGDKVAPLSSSWSELILPAGARLQVRALVDNQIHFHLLSGVV